MWPEGEKPRKRSTYMVWACKNAIADASSYAEAEAKIDLLLESIKKLE